MSDIALPNDRALTEGERQAFKRLGLTPGHLAALVAAPFFSRSGARVPNLRDPHDAKALEELRRLVRGASHGYADEALAYWKRLSAGERGLAPLGTRLLAWHLATDLEFDAREHFLTACRGVAARFALPGVRPDTPSAVFRDLRRLIDAYFAYPTFTADVDPVWTSVAPPGAEVLTRLAGGIAPIAGPWPAVPPAQVAARMRALVDVFGLPVSDWWERPDAGRRAIERGLAARGANERETIYERIQAEWLVEVESSFRWPNSPQFAAFFVDRLREWTDAVRKAARAVHASGPPAAVPDETAPIVVSHPEPAPGSADRPAEPQRNDSVRAPVPPPDAAPKLPAKPVPERVTATVAAPFNMVGLDAALARARTTTVADVCAWVDTGPRLLFDDGRDPAAREVAVVRDGATVPSPLWVIGDLHADILTLANAVAHAESHSAPAHFVFLGDFVDRGIHDHELLLFLFGLVMSHPERVCVIPGNHDTDLRFDEPGGRFRVTIDPAEYCEELNAARERDGPEDRERVTLARAFIRFCADRPKAVFLPDGTLFAHGGFPHTDAQKDIATVADLCRPRCLDDFLWARIAESARVKRPNRGSRGHEFGWDTFAQFCKLAGERLGVPVKRLVRGHDHVPDRWQEYPEYADNFVPVLTLNAMGRALDGDSPRRDGRRHPLPVIGRYVPDRLPEVVALPLDPAEVDRAFGRPGPGGATAALGEVVDQLLARVTRDEPGAEGGP
ncbi:metallophosphoesterase family protein [Frigoriglobus tundricola]|uniref:Serine/threonine specific protein phosphatases domain-containing protein n=1 Tax=Frigoriglobus tundricola TaxID=2774151 RepID=A0A6M5YZC9_9BACT|nr:metallophosphoesterase family protein [Frigoriglobus tundricola]QJW99487.1 hypothetical protein FTUN_7099 [Frigoriglobus tundricola]